MVEQILDISKEQIDQVHNIRDLQIIPPGFDTDVFRKPAIKFQKDKNYVDFPVGSGRWLEYWNQEKQYCLDGIEVNGVSITGFHYFYLNYCPIKKLVKEEVIVRGEKRVKKYKKLAFPDFYDYDKYYFDTVENAQLAGEHLVVLKARRKGYSFKAGSMLMRNFYLKPASMGYVIAAEKRFLTEDGTLSKAWSMMDHLDQYTAWHKHRQAKDTMMHKRASYYENVGGIQVEVGYKSEILGVTIKNDAQKIRGISADLIFFEEAGKNPNLVEAWMVAESSMSVGVDVFGLMIAFGCVCAGTKVWDGSGNLVNIEDLDVNKGIVGFKFVGVSKEPITYWQPPSKKECVRITTNTGRSLECSTDHPILWSTQKFGKKVELPPVNGKRRRKFSKSAIYKEAQSIKIGDQVAVVDHVPIWGNKKMWEPRLIGWLIGDGTYGIDHSPRLSNCEIEITSYVEEKYDSKITKQYTTKDGKEYKEIRIKGICGELRKLGIYGQTKLKKTLPVDIHSYCKEDVLELIGGLFDTDGYVSYHGKAIEISISSASQELLKEILFLLQKIGVHSFIKRIKKSKKNPIDRNDHYRLVISDKRSVLKFAELVTLFPGEKQFRLDLAEDLFKYTNLKGNAKLKHTVGVRFERVVKIETIGEQFVYNLTAGDTHTYIANGMITHNTGGSDGADFAGLKELFYKPKAYGCYGMKNIWDISITGECGFFVPDFVNHEGFIKPNGESMMFEAFEYRLNERKKMSDDADQEAIDRATSEHPFNPMEATFQARGNIFPGKKLMEQLTTVELSEKMANKDQRGELFFREGGGVKFEIDGSLRPILEFPTDRKSSKGCLQIWEHPYINEDGVVPKWLYILGNDPYDQDNSTTDSLGSTFVWKRFLDGTQEYNIIVAEYTGRPNLADEYYEVVRMLALYYNGTIMYENNIKGLHKYFSMKRSDYLLADTPETKDVIRETKVNRGKGIHMTKEIIAWGEQLIKKMLLEFDGKKYGYEKIYSIPLLRELIAYNKVGNFDRVRALMCLLIYNEHIYDYTVKKQKNTSNFIPVSIWGKHKSSLI